MTRSQPTASRAGDAGARGAMNDSMKRDGFTLRRWSQRKLAAARGDTVAPEPLADSEKSVPAPSAALPPSPVDTAPPSVELPPVDSLTIESDFSPFIRPDVDERVKRDALRKLFSDPHFNAMDGLDVYIDDYSKAAPIAPDIVRTLVQARYIFDPPKTRVNARGEVEEVPADEAAAQPPADEATAPPAIEAALADPPAAQADGDREPVKRSDDDPPT